MMPPGVGLADRVLVGVAVLSGPIVEAVWDAEFHPAIRLGWLGPLLALAHPVRPNPVTAGLTLAGLALWFFAGFLAVTAVV